MEVVLAGSPLDQYLHTLEDEELTGWVSLSFCFCFIFVGVSDFIFFFFFFFFFFHFFFFAEDHYVPQALWEEGGGESEEEWEEEEDEIDREGGWKDKDEDEDEEEKEELVPFVESFDYLHSLCESLLGSLVTTTDIGLFLLIHLFISLFLCLFVPFVSKGRIYFLLSPFFRAPNNNNSFGANQTRPPT